MFLPHTFHGGGYDVTVNADRSIKIRPGDWLSKYSMAIYGNFDHTDKFMEKNTDKSMEKKRGVFRPVDNPNLIRAGEILYHPDPLPGESTIPPAEGVPGKGPPNSRKEYHRPTSVDLRQVPEFRLGRKEHRGRGSLRVLPHRSV